MLSLTVLTATLSFYMLQRVDTVLMVANAKLSVYVLSLTVLTATLSFTCCHGINGCKSNA